MDTIVVHLKKKKVRNTEKFNMQRSFMNIHRTCFQVRKVRGIVTKLEGPEMVVSATLIFRRLQRPYRFEVLRLHHLSAKSFTGQKFVLIVIMSSKKL